jgi:hypothetical protein
MDESAETEDDVDEEAFLAYLNSPEGQLALEVCEKYRRQSYFRPIPILIYYLLLMCHFKGGKKTDRRAGIPIIEAEAQRRDEDI